MHTSELGNNLIYHHGDFIITQNDGIVLKLNGLRGPLFERLIRDGTGSTVSREALVRAVWDSEDTFIHNPALSQQIYLLRKELTRIGLHNYIISISGKGYRTSGEYLLQPKPGRFHSMINSLRRIF